MEDENYIQAKECALWIEREANERGRAILKVASRLDPQRFPRRAALFGDFDHIDWEKDEVVFANMAAGEVYFTSMPVEYLFYNDWEDKIRQERKDREEAESIAAQLHKESERVALEIRKRAIEELERREYSRLKKKYG